MFENVKQTFDSCSPRTTGGNVIHAHNLAHRLHGPSCFPKGIQSPKPRVGRAERPTLGVRPFHIPTTRNGLYLPETGEKCRCVSIRPNNVLVRGWIALAIWAATPVIDPTLSELRTSYHRNTQGRPRRPTLGMIQSRWDCGQAIFTAAPAGSSICDGLRISAFRISAFGLRISSAVHGLHGERIAERNVNQPAAGQ